MFPLKQLSTTSSTGVAQLAVCDPNLAHGLLTLRYLPFSEASGCFCHDDTGGGRGILLCLHMNHCRYSLDRAF